MEHHLEKLWLEIKPMLSWADLVKGPGGEGGKLLICAYCQGVLLFRIFFAPAPGVAILRSLCRLYPYGLRKRRPPAAVDLPPNRLRTVFTTTTRSSSSRVASVPLKERLISRSARRLTSNSSATEHILEKKKRREETRAVEKIGYAWRLISTAAN